MDEFLKHQKIDADARRSEERNDRHKENFISFIDNINPNKKIAIIAHGNCSDGMASTVFLTELLQNKYRSISFPLCIFIDYSIDMYGELLINRLRKEKIEYLFVLDVGMNPQNVSSFEELSRQFSVCYVDHHPSDFIPSSPKCVIKTESADCTTLMLYRFSEEFIDVKKWFWLVCAVAVSEFSYKKQSNLEFLKKYYPSFSRENIENTVSFKMSNVLGSLIKYYKNEPLKALEIIIKQDFEFMNKINKEVFGEIERVLNLFTNSESHYNESIYFFNISSRFDVSSSVSTILSIKNLGKTIVTFSEDEGDVSKVKVSARNNTEPIPYSMKSMIEFGIIGLSESTAGGHLPAAGAVILRKDLETFKKRVLEFVASKLN